MLVVVVVMVVVLVKMMLLIKQQMICCLACLELMNTASSTIVAWLRSLWCLKLLDSVVLVADR